VSDPPGREVQPRWLTATKIARFPTLPEATTPVVLLLGMEINAERERSVELDAGVPRAEREIQLEPRDTPKPKEST